MRTRALLQSTVLAAVLALALAACGSDPTPTPTAEPTATPTPTAMPVADSGGEGADDEGADDEGDDHGHDEGDGHGHDEGDDHGHDEGDGHGHDEGDGHGHDEGDDHGHDEGDGHGHDEGDDHGHDEGDEHEGHDHGELAPTATPMPTATPDPAFERATGDVGGVVFVVGEGSKATFSVGEVLVNVSLPDYEAVLRTTRISGEVRLDGGPSLLSIDLHSMVSDDTYRDRYVQNRMFPGQPSASVAFGDLTPLPAGFTDGEEVEAEVTGTLSINDMDVPLVFAVEARDDGDIVYVVGRTSFTWDEIGEPVPSAPVIVSLEDEVRAEILLALTPMPAP